MDAVSPDQQSACHLLGALACLQAHRHLSVISDPIAGGAHAEPN